MFNFFDSDAPTPTPHEIAQSFRWLGWIGLCLQALLGFMPILVVTTTVLFNPRQRQIGFSLGLWLAIACLIALIFSIYWCFRYTLLAHQLENPDLRPAKSQVIKDVKRGLALNLGIIAIAVCIALWRVSELTVKMLSLPQGGTVVTPNPIGTTVAVPGTLITPSNMIAIQAMVSTIAAGLAGTLVALLLLHQIGLHRSTNR